jgi:hypothetical protein
MENSFAAGADSCALASSRALRTKKARASECFIRD